MWRDVRGIVVLIETPRAAALTLLYSRCVESGQGNGAFGIDPHWDPGLRLPRGDIALRVGRDANVHRLRRPFGIPAVLVLAHPLHTHRTPERLRQDHGIGARVLMPVLSVASGPFDVNQADFIE